MKIKSLGLLGLLTLSLSATAANVPNLYHYKSLHLKGAPTVINGETFGAESPSVSSDGQKVCWIAKAKDRKTQIPSDIFIYDTITKETKKFSKGKRKLNAFVKCGFDQDNNIIASELGYRPFAISRTLIHGLMHELEPRGFQPSISFFNEDGKRIKRLLPKELGRTKKKMFLKHPKISPDGKWLTYYVSDLAEDFEKGIYVVNMETKKSYHLNAAYDKHPTWTPDGTKILFHYQTNATKNKPEMAYIGYFDLKFDGDQLVSWNRIMLDKEKSGTYVYHKHPAVFGNTGLLLFHGQKSSKGKKKMFIRDMQNPKNIYEIKMKNTQGIKLNSKHPATSYTNDGAYFVSKIKGGKYKIMMIDAGQLETLMEKMK